MQKLYLEMIIPLVLNMRYNKINRKSATFDNISFLIVEGECEEWCSTIVEICE